MKAFGKIESQFWDSLRHQQVSDQGKILAAYLLTCKHGNMLGIFSLPSAYIMGDLGWDASMVSRTLHELVTNEFLTISEHHDYLCINKFIEHNKTENAKQIDARLRLLLHLPDTLPLTLPPMVSVIDQALQKASKSKPSKDTRSLIEQVRRRFETSSEEVRLENKRNREVEKSLKDICTSSDVPGQKPASHNTAPDQATEFPDHFEQWWSQYPQREGRKGHKRQSFSRYRTRIGEGLSQEAMLANVMNYARYCDLTGKTGTEYVMQTVTYLNDPDNVKNQWTVNHENRQSHSGKLSLVEQVEQANAHILHPEGSGRFAGQAAFDGQGAIYDVEPEGSGEPVFDDDRPVRSEVDQCIRSG